MADDPILKSLGERPAALDVDAGRVILVGTVLFWLAAAVLACFWGWLGDHDHRIWFWTALAGGLLGIAGWFLMAKHRREGRVR